VPIGVNRRGCPALPRGFFAAYRRQEDQRRDSLRPAIATDPDPGRRHCKRDGFLAEMAQRRRGKWRV